MFKSWSFIFGTCKENNLDAIKKKILPFGQIGMENHKCKINDNEVYEIKTLLKYGMKQYKIAKIFNVSQSLISLIKHGKLRGEIFLKQA